MDFQCFLWFLFGFLSFCTGSEIVSSKRNFTIYWNVPTDQCNRHNYNANETKPDFPTLLANLSIVHNVNGSFRGEEFRILYSPGLWPSMEHNKTVNGFHGGMPHHGDLMKHLEQLEADINNCSHINYIPKNFTGMAVIDMESWRPVFRQNTGWMKIYRKLVFREIDNNATLREKAKLNASITCENNRTSDCFKVAAEIFEPMAIDYMNKSIAKVRELRPEAHWGYYGFPYCFNIRKNDRNESCPKPVPKENNNTAWLFQSYDSWYPSVYISHDNFTEKDRQNLVSGRVKEYNRLRNLTNQNATIYPYVWLLYNLDNRTEVYLNETDLKMTLTTLKNYTMDGAVIWGMSQNVNTSEKCLDLYKYVNETLKPILEGLNITRHEPISNNTILESQKCPKNNTDTTNLIKRKKREIKEDAQCQNCLINDEPASPASNSNSDSSIFFVKYLFQMSYNFFQSVFSQI